MGAELIQSIWKANIRHPQTVLPDNKRAGSGGCGGEENNDVHHGIGEDAPFHGSDGGASQADPSAHVL